MSINLLNINRIFEINSSIIEWDMKRAGLSLIKELQLLPESEIKELSFLSKKDCDFAIGKKQIKNKQFSKDLEQAFTDIMNKFLDTNRIDRDLDILSIKKDACFVINRDIKTSDFGEYIHFVPKNQYHAYVYINPLEFYFQKDGEIEVKNLIGDKKERRRILSLHRDGILNFLAFAIELAERSGCHPKEMNSFLHDFVVLYKNKELEFDYYREFNTSSKYRYQFAGAEIMAENIDESMLQKVNIEYNYIHIILPFINILV